MSQLTDQELHNLAMNIVGKDLEEQGYEFLGVNSEFKKDPQFVALKDKKLHFVIVRAIEYPHDPKEMDMFFLETIKQHAQKFDARTFYAGVGLANSKDYDLPVSSSEDYVVNYHGLKEI
ncbi:Na(+)-translocating NADH-quinone reductase subunit F [Salinimicrobium sp. CAU 1759]